MGLWVCGIVFSWISLLLCWSCCRIDEVIFVAYSEVDRVDRRDRDDVIGLDERTRHGPPVVYRMSNVVLALVVVKFIYFN